MKFKIQLITQHEAGEEIQELACLERETEGLEAVSITLEEAKALLATLQRQVVEQQIALTWRLGSGVRNVPRRFGIKTSIRWCSARCLGTWNFPVRAGSSVIASRTRPVRLVLLPICSRSTARPAPGSSQTGRRHPAETGAARRRQSASDHGGWISSV